MLSKCLLLSILTISHVLYASSFHHMGNMKTTFQRLTLSNVNKVGQTYTSNSKLSLQTETISSQYEGSQNNNEPTQPTLTSSWLEADYEDIHFNESLLNNENSMRDLAHLVGLIRSISEKTSALRLLFRSDTAIAMGIIYHHLHYVFMYTASSLMHYNMVIEKIYDSNMAFINIL